MLPRGILPGLTRWLSAALLLLAGCGKPCDRLADRTCDDLGPGTICNQAKVRAIQKGVNHELCHKELQRWPKTLVRLKAAQAAQSQLLRIAPGALKPKILAADAGAEKGGHHEGDGHDHGNQGAPGRMRLGPGQVPPAGPAPGSPTPQPPAAPAGEAPAGQGAAAPAGDGG